MTFNDQVEAKFENVIAQSRSKRGAVVPLALLARDLVGAITPDLVTDIADRLGLTEPQVREELSFYSILPMKRAAGRVIPFPSRNSRPVNATLRRAA